MRITVFGTGYVGLVQGSVLAEVGHDVLCVDVDAAKVEGLKAGQIPIYEPGLEEMVRKNHAEGRLSFTTDAAEGVRHGRIQFIAVGTPPDEDGSADLKYVLAVAATIASHMAEPKVVVTKSTVPVGTADKVQREAWREVLGEPRLGSRLRRGLEPGVPQGGRGGRRLHAARPHRHRHLRRASPRSCCARSMPRSAATTRRSSSWTCARPS